MTKNNKDILINTNSGVNNSYLNWEKSQSINQPNSGFFPGTAPCYNGQIIAYRLYIQSTTNSPIYNIKVKDPLSSNLSYIPGTFYGRYGNTTSNDIRFLYGTVKFDSTGSAIIDGKTVGGTIEWTIPQLVQNNNTIPSWTFLDFQCQVVCNPS